MHTRRGVLGAVGTTLAAGSAGCLDAVPFVGDEPIGFEASASVVPDPVRSEAGYEESNRTDLVVERTYEVAGQTQDVVVTNRLVEYDKAIDFGATGLPLSRRVQAAIFVALTTPQVDVLGRTFNPVGNMDSADLAAMVQDHYEGMENLRQVGEESRSVAGQSTTVGEFEGRANLVGPGLAVDLTLHIGEAVEVGDDFVVAIGGYPSVVRDREAPDVFTMMAGIEHGE